MKVAYVLDRPELGGGVKVVLQHAELLRGLGHEVVVLGRGRRPRWVRYRGRYVDYRGWGRRTPLLAPDVPDLVIATYWTTFAAAEGLGLRPAVHFCQGFEGHARHLRPHHEEIEAIYRRPLPALVPAPHLAEFLNTRYGREAALAPPPLDPRFRPHRRLAPRARPRIALFGAFEFDIRGVETGLEAIRLLRARGLHCRVVRVSPLPLSLAERRVLPPDRYLSRAHPRRVARVLRGCDLLLFPSRAEEGFGLPALEAMASKVPVVASDIPSMGFIGGAVRVPPGRSVALADAAEQLLRQASRWCEAADRGLSAAQAFHPARVAPALEQAIEWARERALRSG